MPSTSLPDELNALLRQRWPFCCDRIVHQGVGTDAIPLNDPSACHALETCFERYCGGMPDEDRRGLGSLWVQWYAVTVWPPLVTGILVRGAMPPLADPGTALLVDSDGCPAGLRIAPGIQSGEPAALLDLLADEHAAPLLATISGTTAMAPRVPWSNVANVLGWMLGELGAVVDEATLVPGYDLLARRLQPDGRRNPLYTSQCSGPCGSRPGRRVCCLRYRLTGFDYCGDCPIPTASR